MTATPAEHSVVSLIEAQADREGGRVALIGRDRVLTFEAMNRAANRLAGMLQDRLGPGSGFVAVCLPPCVERIIAVLGILKSGRGYVVIDPRLHDQGRRDLAGHADALCVVTDPILAAGFEPELRTLDVAGCWLPGDDHNPGLHPGPEAAAYLRYTSGSTGQPKGVLHNHRAALGQGLAFVETVGLRAGDCLCHFTFFPHAVVLGSLAIGAALHVVDATGEGLRAIAGRIRQDRVSVLECFPSILRSLSVTLLPGGPLPDLRVVTLSGEPVATGDINLALRLMPEGGIVTNNYGSSEFVQIASHAIRGALQEGDAVPVGRPPSGVEVRLIDAKGDPVAPGGIGEITVRAPFMTSGYWKRPDLTQEVFGTLTPQDGRGHYRTGDVGCVGSDGLLSVLGRVDNQIKLRAHRITPEEIESVLLRHPAVADAAVRAFADRSGSPFLVAYLVPAPGAAVEPAAVRRFAQAHLPRHMVPSSFHAIEALPRTVAGKLDRSALPGPDAQGRISEPR
jgi:acyl-coenzyme A synthetase/AMP-(fatty) acid ligase